MKIEFRCKVKSFELSNFIIAEAVRSLEAYPERLKELELTVEDLELIKEFRDKMVQSVIKNGKKK